MAHKPTTSIIIPTFNRTAPLENCLKSLAALNLPRNRTEVIVVNDGGVIHVNKLLDHFGPSFSFKIQHQKQSGPAQARNRGAGAAKGKHLVFLDDDCRVPLDWFVQLESAIRKHPGAIIGGRIVNGLPANPYAATSQALIDYMCANQGNLTRAHSFFTTNNLIVPTSVSNRIGGFNPRYPFAGEDREMCYRWHRAGGRLVFVPNLLVFHFHHMNFAAFWHQHYRYGRGALRYHVNCARYESRRHIKLEPLKFYIGLFVFKKRNCGSLACIIRLLLMLTSQLATAVGFMSLFIRHLFGRLLQIPHD